MSLSDAVNNKLDANEPLLITVSIESRKNELINVLEKASAQNRYLFIDEIQDIEDYYSISLKFVANNKIGASMTLQAGGGYIQDYPSVFNELLCGKNACYSRGNGELMENCADLKCGTFMHFRTMGSVFMPDGMMEIWWVRVKQTLLIETVIPFESK